MLPGSRNEKEYNGSERVETCLLKAAWQSSADKKQERESFGTKEEEKEKIVFYVMDNR